MYREEQNSHSQQAGTKEIPEKIWPSGVGELQGTVQEIDIWPHWQMVYAQSRIPLGKWNTKKILYSFGMQTDPPVPASRLKLMLVNKKKKTCNLVDFAVPLDNRLNMKESKKLDKYFDPTREHESDSHS